MCCVFPLSAECVCGGGGGKVSITGIGDSLCRTNGGIIVTVVSTESVCVVYFLCLPSVWGRGKRVANCFETKVGGGGKGLRTVFHQTFSHN